jgi:hypothetical protein
MKGENMKHNLRQNLTAFFSFFLAATFFAGCIAAVPIIVHYAKGDDGYVATAEVNESADELWQSVTQLADKRVAEGRGKIVEKEDSDRLMKVTDGIQTAEVKVDPKEGGGSEIIVRADIPDEKDKKVEEKKEEELALRIMKDLCEEAEADCKIVKKE